MIEIREVKTRKEIKDFLEFPLKLYKDNPCFVPPLYSDEKKMFKKNFVYRDTCEMVCYNAYKDGKIVGRVSGILQKAANEKYNEKRIRFSKIDGIDDPEVFKALMDAVETWGKALGMDTICGPLGFSDLEREGLLIDGFDQLSTFEEQYNAPYYQTYLEELGYEKEVDWFESYLQAPNEEEKENLRKMSDFIMKRYHLHWGESKSTRDFIKKYKDRFFELLDRAYEHIYGTVPFTEGMKKMMIDNFNLILKTKYVGILLDENENIVALGICFPALAKAIQKSGGKLTPPALIRILKDINHPKVLDLGLIGVEPEYLNRGVSACIASALVEMIERDHIEHCETNLNLEDNFAIRNLWKRFNTREHKKRRSYVKRISE